MKDKLDKVTSGRDSLKEVIDVSKEAMNNTKKFDRRKEQAYEANHKKLNDAKEKYDRVLIQKQDKHPHVYGFYTTLAKKISQVISAIQQALLKLNH